MVIKYYKLIADGYSDTGVMYAPKEWPRPVAKDAVPVENWQSLVLELKDGPYCHYNKIVGSANVISKELKELLQSFLNNGDDYLEFLPVKVVSKEYGDKKYFIMHFKKIFDVIDSDNTVFGPCGRTVHDVILLRVLYEKVKDLKVFNFRPLLNDVIVSEDIYKAIIKNKLKKGIDFQPIYCVK